MLKLQEKGLFTTDKATDSAFIGFHLGVNNEQDGANYQRQVMVLKVATNPTAAETMGIGTKTYTFVASGATGDQINIGTLPADTLLNIINKINEDAIDAGCTAYVLQNPIYAALVANEVTTTPTFTPDGVKVISDVAWTNVMPEAKLEDVNYFRVPLTDVNTKPIVLVERNAGTYQNFLY